MGTCVHKERCPQCAAKGNDEAGDNLAIYDSGGAYCFSCGYAVADGYKSGTIESKEIINVMPTQSLEAIMSKRGINAEALKAYDVKLLQDDATGEMYVNFPIPDVNGKSVYAQKRYFNPTTGELSRSMKFEKGTKLTNPLFGWHLITKKTKTIVVCEGNTDALAMASRLPKNSDIAVLGLVGATNAKRAAAQIVRHAPKAEVVLALDNDEAGRTATEVFVAYYQENSELAVSEIRFNYKDVSDWLMVEPETDVLQEIKDAEPFLSSDIVGAAEITDSFIEYLDTIEHEKYIKIEFSPTLSNSIRLMPGKLVTVAGDSGKGKSTFVEQIALEALAQGRNVFFISAEMKPAEVALKLVRNSRGIDYYDRKVLLDMTEEQRTDLRAYTTLLLKRLKMFARFGSCGVGEIEDKIHELVAANVAPDLIIIDHILAISNEGSTEELEQIAKSLKAIAERHEVPIIILSHVRKQMQQNKRTIYRPQLSDIYNSGGLARYSDIALGVALDPEKKLTFVETIKMERMGGGFADVLLKMENWSLQEVDESATNGVKSKYTDDGDDDDEYETEYL